MGFFQAIGRCYGNMFNFSGRARRSEYWWFFLFQILTAMGAQAWAVWQLFANADFVASMETPEKLTMWFEDNPQLFEYAGYAFAAWLILFFVPHLSVTIRRLHDTDRSGWMILMPTAVSIGSGLIGGFLIGATAASGNIGGMMFWAIGVTIVPLIASLYFFVLLCLPGTHGNNRFGGDPAPDRKRPMPSHPAFAPEAPVEDRAALAEARRAEARDYYKRNVLPSIQRA